MFRSVYVRAVHAQVATTKTDRKTANLVARKKATHTYAWRRARTPRLSLTFAHTHAVIASKLHGLRRTGRLRLVPHVFFKLLQRHRSMARRFTDSSSPPKPRRARRRPHLRGDMCRGIAGHSWALSCDRPPFSLKGATSAGSDRFAAA